MLNSVFLFTGENIYLLRQEFQRRKNTFVEKFWVDSLFIFNSENRDFWAVKQALYAWGLFVSKKMVIFEGIPKDLAQEWWLSADKIDKFIEDFQNNIKLLSPDTTILFLCYKPDKRTKTYKRLSENVTVKSFDNLKDSQLKQFVKDQVSPLIIWSNEITYFLDKVWTDMYRISNEIEKLKYWLKEGTTITKEIIDEFVFWLIDSNTFALFNKLFKNKIDAVRYLEKLQNEWKERWNLIWPITWNLKVFLTLIDYGNRWIKDSKQIIAETKLAPMTVATNIKNMDLLLKHQETIKSMFMSIIDIDYAIKNGKYPDTYFWLTLKKLFLETNF